jgi:1-acyl-sn-glycerol-3-phosphate acyltransferase
MGDVRRLDHRTMKLLTLPLRLVLTLALYANLLLLGLMSTVWNFIAMLLYPLLPREHGLVVGRAGIAYGYRLFWWLASLTGMIRLAVQDVKTGGQLVLFPEGTRTTRQPLNAFRPGVTLIAKLANAPIQTAFIDTRSPYLGKGWPIWKLPPLPIVFSVRLGERFAPSDDPDALLHTLQVYLAQGVLPREQP